MSQELTSQLEPINAGMTDSPAHFPRFNAATALYNLYRKDNGQWLVRWPGKNGSPALWSDDRSQATEFRLDEFQGLAGYWDYARYECTCRLKGW